mmetsp:Transcript_9219/g.27767  ORF Transcript_9219/g.27767 Transcript_9219/m.27767 type:complete len:96 (-) Transcript_9219:159-446(-)
MPLPQSPSLLRSCFVLNTRWRWLSLGSTQQLRQRSGNGEIRSKSANRCTINSAEGARDSQLGELTLDESNEASRLFSCALAIDDSDSPSPTERSG